MNMTSGDILSKILNNSVELLAPISSCTEPIKMISFIYQGIFEGH
jgi:hypothetical protein